jgi:hypothetical protein
MQWHTGYVGMALGVILVAFFLGLWQWYETQGRDTDLDEEDRRFFRRQDLRRWSGIGLMLLLAVAIIIADRWEDGQFLQIAANVAGLIGLILALLVLALIDSLATLRYARRHRRELTNEHAQLMLEVIRRAGAQDSMRRAPEKKSEIPEA